MGRRACTELQCLYSTTTSLLLLWGRTDCTERQFLYSTFIALPQLWAVQAVQDLSACILQVYFYTYNGTYGI